MTVRVVDASALGALLFGEPQAEEMAHKMGDAELVAPALLWYEAASICLKKIKKQPNAAGKLLSAFALLPALSIREVEIDHGAVIEMARAKGLTTYDASYLWLAVRLQAELISLDKKLLRVASG